MKQKQDDTSSQELDHNNPSGAVQTLDDVPKTSSKTVSKMIGAWAKKNPDLVKKNAPTVEHPPSTRQQNE